MSKERILNKKLKDLNQLKLSLVERSEKPKKEVMEAIKETVEEIEIILEDFQYINNHKDE